MTNNFIQHTISSSTLFTNTNSTSTSTSKSKKPKTEIQSSELKSSPNEDIPQAGSPAPSNNISNFDIQSNGVSSFPPQSAQPAALHSDAFHSAAFHSAALHSVALQSSSSPPSNPPPTVVQFQYQSLKQDIESLKQALFSFQHQTASETSSTILAETNKFVTTCAQTLQKHGDDIIQQAIDQKNAVLQASILNSQSSYEKLVELGIKNLENLINKNKHFKS